jgi:ribosomal-protein-alanine N-acetyltransferase
MQVIMETPRLIIRKTELSDVPNMMELNSDPLVTQFTGDGAFNSTSQAEIVAQSILKQYADFGFGRWMFETKDTHEFIGWCGLKYHPDRDEVDLGYRLLRKHWGKGYATEASHHCINYGFEKLDIKRIIGRALKQNTASIRVFEKLGMKFLEEKILHNEEAVIYEISKERY